MRLAPRGASATPAIPRASSSLPGARLPRAEEPDERLDDAAVGMHRDLVDRESAKQLAARIDLLLHRIAEPFAHGGVARVDVERLARLGIDEPRETDVGQRPLARIIHGHGDDVVPLREQLERMLDVLRLEIRHDEDDRLVRDHLARELERGGEIGARTDGFEDEKVAHETERMPPSL